jgi:hypothetical protein
MQLFAGGGLLALLGWLGWVATVGLVLLAGLRSLTGERRLLLVHGFPVSAIALILVARVGLGS